MYKQVCQRCGKEYRSKIEVQPLCSVCRAIERRKSAPKKRKKTKTDSLGEMLREIQEYNDRHGTALSYGRYIYLKSIGGLE